MSVYVVYEKGLRQHIAKTCSEGLKYDFMDLNSFKLGKEFWSKVNNGKIEDQEALDTFHSVTDELFCSEYDGLEYMYTYKG